MVVVLEGPDGGGKSTLAQMLSQATGLPIKAGEGPPRYKGEFHERVDKYLRMDDVIFDRHPVISQPIYARLRGSNEDLPTPEQTYSFYSHCPFIIYCRSTDDSKHRVGADEDPAHIEAVHRHYAELVRAYDEWAVKRANMIYRMGDANSSYQMIRLLSRL